MTFKTKLYNTLYNKIGPVILSLTNELFDPIEKKIEYFLPEHHKKDCELISALCPKELEFLVNQSGKLSEKQIKMIMNSDYGPCIECALQKLKSNT